MGVDQGFRYGSRKDSYPAGGEFVFQYGDHPKYVEIRKDQHKLDRMDGMLQAMEKKLVMATNFVRYMRVLLLGGHVRRAELGQVKDLISPRDDPEETMRAFAERMKDLETMS